MKIRVLISGRNYDAAQGIPDQLTLPDGASLDDALAALALRLGNGERLPESSLVAVSGVHLGTVRRHSERVLREGDELIVLSPVAGG
jgi:sulfur carrier protein ThiS